MPDDDPYAPDATASDVGGDILRRVLTVLGVLVIIIIMVIVIAINV